MTHEDIHAVDRSHMYDLLCRFPAQAREAVEIGRTARLTLRAQVIDRIVVCGLGGSAIGGDLLRSYLFRELTVPMIVNRHYLLPEFVGQKTLVVISSYSGNTEETNAAHREALRRKAKLLCITSGGVTESLARRRKSPLIKLPGGLPPRIALGYSFFPLLVAFVRAGFIKDRPRDITETLELLDRKSAEYSAPDPATNRALQLAGQLRGRIGVFYSSTEHIDAVNTRWRGQLAENAKTLCFGNVLPEMNHNEIVGWRSLRDQMREIQVFFLRDRSDHRRVQMRMDITKEIIDEHTPHVTEIWSEGSSLLTRMFSLIVLGDWVSFYLAVLHGVDPTPVEAIDNLKQQLARP